MTAIYGYNFCNGARKSFTLLAKNAVRAVVLDKVADFVLFMGKLLVVIIVTAATFALFSNKVTDSLGKPALFQLTIPNLDNASDIQLNYQFVPMAIIILGSYAIASTFFSVYSMAVDTIFLCFLQVLLTILGIFFTHDE